MDTFAVSSDLAVRLRGVAAMVSLEDKDLKRDLNLETRRSILPYMKSTLSGSAPTPLARRIARTATVQTSRGFPFLKVTGKVGAKSSRRTNVAAGVEFGAVGIVRIRYTARKPNGGTHDVVRRTTRTKFGPRNENGKWIYPAAERMAPAVADAWLTVVQDYYERQATHNGA
jgi:hypothetical protein